MATLSVIGITAKVTDLAIYVTGLTIFARISIMPVCDTLPFSLTMPLYFIPHTLTKQYQFLKPFHLPNAIGKLIGKSKQILIKV